MAFWSWGGAEIYEDGNLVNGFFRELSLVIPKAHYINTQHEIIGVYDYNDYCRLAYGVGAIIPLDVDVDGLKQKWADEAVYVWEKRRKTAPKVIPEGPHQSAGLIALAKCQLDDTEIGATFGANMKIYDGEISRMNKELLHAAKRAIEGL